MALINVNKVKKYFQDRLILDIDELEIREGEKVGLVGVNGSGKTTLLNILCGKVEQDAGNIFIDNSYVYISQMDTTSEYEDYLSGGEKVKARINKALDENTKIIIADEPTSNLDSNSIKFIEDKFKSFKGTILLVSHDREFLDNICTKIIELDDGKLYIYKGNYSSYVEQKKEKFNRKKFEYEQYANEKSRLEEAVFKKTSLRQGMKKTPKRFGNSEARLHRMGNQTGEKTVDNAVKAIKSRIDRLEVKEKPKTDAIMKIDIVQGKEFFSNYPIDIKDLSLGFEDKVLIENSSFKLKKNKRVALLGDNGCGKTTLIKTILNDGDNIKIANRVNIGYFQQDLKILDDNKTIIENIKDSSSFDETFIRIVLARFLFKGDIIYKKVGVLSGGEQVRVALCKVILSDNNLLILDEPTNYLDISSMEALEEALKNSNKTMLIVSHDRRFVSSVCNEMLFIKDKKLIHFPYSYEEWINKSHEAKITQAEKNKEERLLVLKNNMAEVISLISIEVNADKRKEYDIRYKELLMELKQLS